MLVVDYFSDVLCVWAWIAQRRLDELQADFGADITIRHHYMDIFGAVGEKMSSQWSQRGGYKGFAEHVATAVTEYEDAPVNAENWLSNRPATSANAHLFIKAVDSVHGSHAATTFAHAVRKAFFIEARDIASHEVLQDILEEQAVEPDRVLTALTGGDAMAALMSDYQLARQLNLRGSPSYVMNDERQILYGNVGYRVLRTNVEELLKQVSHEASWC